MAIILPITVIFADTDEAATALYGTPELGTNDLLWQQTMEHVIDRSTVPDDPRPKATGTARILWDEDFVYARVEVEDENVYVGDGQDHTYDSIEFYLGSGSTGSNQWRISSTGIWSGQNAQGRAGWTEITDDGYIVEVRIPKGNLELVEGPLTFEVYINNSSANGGDRYEVVSAFGIPDVGYSSSESFENSLTLVGADQVDTRYSITATAGSGGSILPSAPGDVLRVEEGEDITFEFIPDSGQMIDTVTVDDEGVIVSEDNTYTIENVSANYHIHVTFQYDPGAELFDFIVWNDNFAKGEYTTAVIIDLGEGNAVNGDDLSPELFAVTAQDRMQDGSDAFVGSRRITRVYANDEPAVRGYVGTVANSPDYQPGLDSGRYIVIELEFFTETGGLTTLGINNSNSTIQNYEVVQTGDLTLADGSVRGNVAFVQTDVVNPILDRFTTGNHNTFNYAQYLHRDGNGEVVQGLPLFIYAHGSTRGGTNAEVDQKAAMKSANGAVALMKKMDENPNKFRSHVLNVSSSSGHPNAEDFKAVVDEMIENGWVDPNRIYMSGFSMGAGYTNTIMSTYPGFLAAAAPLAGGGGPSAADNPAHLNTAYWALVNSSDYPFIVGGVEGFVAEGGGFHTLDKALVTIFETNEVFVWPYNQYDQPDQRPPMEGYVGHEIEAAVLYNRVNEPNHNWSIVPGYGELDSRFNYLFDWMFAQSLDGEIGEDPDPVDPEPVDPDPVDPDPDPVDPDPVDPEPTDPDPVSPEPTDPKLEDPEPTDPKLEDPDVKDSDSSNKLPATATNNFNLILIGLALIVVGTLSFIIVRKKTQKSSN